MGELITGPITEQDLMALNAFLVQGYTAKQIHQEIGITRSRLAKLLARSDVKEILDEQRSTFRSGLAAMSDEVLNTLGKLLKHPSGNVQASAVEKWLRAMNMYSPDSIVSPVSAEDVAKALLAEAGKTAPGAKSEVDEDGI